MGTPRMMLKIKTLFKSSHHLIDVIILSQLSALILILSIIRNQEVQYLNIQLTALTMNLNATRNREISVFRMNLVAHRR